MSADNERHHGKPLSAGMKQNSIEHADQQVEPVEATQHVMPTGRRRFVLLIVAVILAVAVLAAVFVAYQQPDMLIDFSNLFFC